MSLKASVKQITQMIFQPYYRHRWYDRRVVNNSRRDYSRTDMTVANVVMAPVLWGARQFIEAPVALNVDGEMDADNDLVRLIRQPNPFYSGTHLLMTSAMALMLTGNCYWIIVRDRSDEPVQLWFAPPWIMDPVSERDDVFIEYYRYTPGGREIELEPRDVVHVRYGLNPKDIRLGYSPLTPALREVYTDEEASNFAASILTNQGMPGVIIMPDTERTIPPKDVDDVKDYFKQRSTGDFRGEPFVMGMRTKVEQFGWEPSKIDLRAIRNVSEERVCALLGIPAAIVGLGTGVQQTKVGATMSELRRLGYENAIIPMQAMFTEEWNRSLLPEFTVPPEAKMDFDLSDVRVLQEDENEKVTRLSRAVGGGWLPVSVAQQLAGFPVDETQNVYLRGPKVVPQAAAIETAAAPAVQTKGRKRSPSSRGEEFYAAQADSREQLADRYAEDLERNFTRLGEEVAERWQTAMQQRRLLSSGNGHAEKQEQVDVELETVAAQVSDEYFAETDPAQFLEKEGHYITVAGETVKNLNTVYGLGWQLTDEDEIAMTNVARNRAHMPDLRSQTKTAITKAIRTGRAEGEGIFPISQRIRDRVGAGPWKTAKTRARVVARTETRYAQNVSAVSVSKRNGAQYVEVLDARLGPTDAYCEGIDGEIVTMADAETLAATEHPNGTRDFAPIFDPDSVPATVRPETPNRERDAVIEGSQ